MGLPRWFNVSETLAEGFSDLYNRQLTSTPSHPFSNPAVFIQFPLTILCYFGVSLVFCKCPQYLVIHWLNLGWRPNQVHPPYRQMFCSCFKGSFFQKVSAYIQLNRVETSVGQGSNSSDTPLTTSVPLRGDIGCLPDIFPLRFQSP